MESTRPYPYVIAAVFLFLVLGFLAGFYGASLVIKSSIKTGITVPAAGNNIMKKRLRAIEAARKAGRDTYEFEVKGFHPVLNKD